jgi:hypothetical protein
MRLNLCVPFRDNAKVKRLGARWDRGRRTWYIENAEDLFPFLKYLPEHLTRPHQPEKEAA